MSATGVFLHLLGAAIWIGGLIFVGLTAGVARRAIPEANRPEFFRLLGSGFLVLAGVAATLLLVSGNILVDDLFGGWNALGDSQAGNLVLWKTGLFVTVLALAVVHAFVLGPRIRRLREVALAGPLDSADDAALRRAAIVSASSQVLMLAGTLVILVLAVDLVT